MKLATIGFFLLLSTSVFAQTFTPIYGPEGVNMPGTWNTWQNTNDALTMGNFRMQRRNLGGGQYVSTISVGSVGQNTTMGSKTMLFTSGPSTNQFVNKWGGANIVMNDTTRLVFGSATDNAINLSVAGYYTFIFDDRGYTNSRVAVMQTTGSPVSIDSIYGLPSAAVPAGQPVTSIVRLNKAPSPEEKVFVRYSVNNWATSAILPAITSFNTSHEATFEIPGQAEGVNLSFYAFTSTVTDQKAAANPDRFTLSIKNNGGANYSIAFGSIPVLIAPAQFSVLRHPRDFEWTPQTNAVRNRLQITRDTNTTFSSPVFDSVITNLTPARLSLRSGILIPGNSYRWRVKADTSSASLWSATGFFTMRPGITFGNLETASTVLNFGDTLRAEGRFYIEGETSKEGAAANVQVFAGLHSSNTNPSTWPTEAWIPADFSHDAGNDDVWIAKTGFNLNTGTYFLAFKYQYFDDASYIGGHSVSAGGVWNGTTNVSSIITVTKRAQPVSPEMNASAVDTLARFSWLKVSDVAGYDFQLTEVTDPTFQIPLVNLVGLADTTIKLDAPKSLKKATWYYWRVRVTGSANSLFSSSMLFKTRSSVGFYNLQFMAANALPVGDTTAVYAQIFINGYTNLPEIASGVEVWIGFSSSANADPSTWEESAWKKAVFNIGSLSANNDEYMVHSPKSLVPGKYFVASRFRYLNGSFLYGGHSATGGGAWQASKNESLVLTIQDPVSNETQRKYSFVLDANFPNPFNPSTMFSFEIPQTGQVQLDILDVNGRTVASLVQGLRQQGRHSVSFDASGLSSGIYLYRLRFEGRQLMRKMTLLK